MAIFGSLGKLIGLDGPTGRGFLEGFAGTTAKLVKEDMDRTDDLVQKTTEYKIQRSQAEAERVEKELRENREKIMGIKGKVGSLAGAEYLVRTYGLEEAINKAGQIETLKGFGVSPEFATKDENQTTIEDLTKFTVSAPAVITTGEIKDTGLLAGIGLGRDIGAEVQARVDQAAETLGTGAFTKPDLGEMPTAKGFDPTDLGMMSDMKDEANRQVRLAISAKENNDEVGYKKHMAAATKMRNMLRTLDVKELTESGGRAFKNDISSHIEEASGLEGNLVSDGMGGYRFKATWQEAADASKVGNASAALTEIYANAIRAGIPAATALRGIYDAASQNRLPSLVQSDTGAYSIVSTPNVLIQGGFSGGKGVFAPSMQAPAGGAGQGATQSTATQQPPASAPANINQLISRHNTAKSSTQKNMFLRRIYTEYGGSQNVPANILSQLK